jgi:XTP/dITP diphosphohydrolase
VTSNVNKAIEIAAFFGETVEVKHIALDIPECRSDNIGEISRGKAAYAYNLIQKPLIVDDTGFSIHDLKGFPGPYAGYVLQTIGNSGILKLMEGKTDRGAQFTTAIAFADDRGIKVFTGTVHGSITLSPRGRAGFGYDPIFEMNGKTLAEIPLEEKSSISHRATALLAFRNWYLHNRDVPDENDTNG